MGAQLPLAPNEVLLQTQNNKILWRPLVVAGPPSRLVEAAHSRLLRRWRQRRSWASPQLQRHPRLHSAPPLLLLRRRLRWPLRQLAAARQLRSVAPIQRQQQQWQRQLVQHLHLVLGRQLLQWPARASVAVQQRRHLPSVARYEMSPAPPPRRLSCFPFFCPAKYLSSLLPLLPCRQIPTDLVWFLQASAPAAESGMDTGGAQAAPGAGFGSGGLGSGGFGQVCNRLRVDRSK